LQKSIFPNTTDLKEGLKQSYLWYKENKDKVNKRDYFGFIDGSKELEEKVEEIKKIILSDLKTESFEV